MGCWGYGIEESDEALDWEHQLYQLAGIDDKAPHFDPASPDIRRRLERNIGKLFDQLEKSMRMRCGAYGDAVGHQTLGVILMRAGCAMSEPARATLRQGSVSCPEYQLADQLANKSPLKRVTRSVVETYGTKVLTMSSGTQGTAERLNGRRDAINTLLATLARYPIQGGIPTDIQSVGLINSLTLPGAGIGIKQRHQPHGQKA